MEKDKTIRPSLQEEVKTRAKKRFLRADFSSAREETFVGELPKS
jgi:hypothetical protein